MEQEPLPGIELTAERLGGRVLSANDEFFAPKENLLKASRPVWLEDEYTDRGKWMDGWETRRRREPGHDWCIIRMGLPGIVRGVVIDTAFFRGNFPESFELEGSSVEDEAEIDGARWLPILPVTRLEGNTVHRFPVDAPWRVSHLRLIIHPDGGVARFKAYGSAVPDRALTMDFDGRFDLARMSNGGEVLAASDMFFSDRNNMIRPGASTHMADGWETKRRRGPGHDWAVVRLGAEGTIESAVIDTTHFKGNAPGRAMLEAVHAPGADVSRLIGGAKPAAGGVTWHALLAETPLEPHRVHEFTSELAATGPVTHVRLSIYPDGGVARLRLFGQPTAAGIESLRIDWLNTLPPIELAERLGRCCAAPGWIRAVSEARPFADRAGLESVSEAALARFDRAELLGALARHPRLGEATAAVPAGGQEAGWSTAEQAGVTAAPDAARDRLAKLNADYERKFGWIFLLCAGGLSADEVIQHLERRLANDAEAELLEAGAEMARIARLRLERLLTP